MAASEAPVPARSALTETGPLTEPVLTELGDLQIRGDHPPADAGRAAADDAAVLDGEAAAIDLSAELLDRQRAGGEIDLGHQIVDAGRAGIEMAGLVVERRIHLVEGGEIDRLARPMAAARPVQLRLRLGLRWACWAAALTAALRRRTLAGAIWPPPPPPVSRPRLKLLLAKLPCTEGREPSADGAGAAQIIDWRIAGRNC